MLPKGFGATDSGYGNVPDLSWSLNISYRGADGSMGETAATALVGNRSSEFILLGGSAAAPNSFAGSVATVGAVEVLGNWFPPDGFRNCGRIAIGNGGTLDIGNRQLDARIVRFNVDFKRSEAYLHCSGFSGRLGCEVVFGGDALANPNSQSYKLIDGLGDCDGQLENLCPINCGFTLAAAGGTICAARNGPHSFADVTAENLPQGLAAEELRRDRLRRRGAAEGEGHRRTNCGAKR